MCSTLRSTTKAYQLTGSHGKAKAGGVNVSLAIALELVHLVRAIARGELKCRNLYSGCHMADKRRMQPRLALVHHNLSLITQ